METLRKLINAETEGVYRMKDETMDSFLGLMTEVKLKRYQVLTRYNTFDDNVYIVKTGIIRTVYFDGFKEITLAFGLPGTLKMVYYSFWRGAPSFCKFAACCDSTVMKITKAQFVGLMKQSHDFSQWVSFISMGQLCAFDRKRELINGDARERFEALIVNRPEILKNVSYRVIASYIGVTPQYLCTLRKEFSHKI